MKTRRKLKLVFQGQKKPEYQELIKFFQTSRIQTMRGLMTTIETVVVSYQISS